LEDTLSNLPIVPVAMRTLAASGRAGALKIQDSGGGDETADLKTTYMFVPTYDRIFIHHFFFLSVSKTVGEQETRLPLAGISVFHDSQMSSKGTLASV
jgi:hypothetical protein